MQVKTTSALEQELSACANFHQFLSENAPAQQTPALAEVLQRALAACGMSRAEVIRRSGLNTIYGYQIFSGKRRPGRDSLLCLGLHLSAEDTQKLLKLTGYAPLYVKNRRDSAVYYALRRGQDAAALNQTLYELGEPMLA